MGEVSRKVSSYFFEDFGTEDGIKGVSTIKGGRRIFIIECCECQVHHSVSEFGPCLDADPYLMVVKEERGEFIPVLGKHSFAHPPTEDFSCRDRSDAPVSLGVLEMPPR